MLICRWSYITVFTGIQDDLQRNVFLFNLMMKESDMKISVNYAKTIAPQVERLLYNKLIWQICVLKYLKICNKPKWWGT
jgi:hypothetical protein